MDAKNASVLQLKLLTDKGLRAEPLSLREVP
jgi:hypothetical protein